MSDCLSVDPLIHPFFTILLQFVVSLLDHSTLPGESTETFLHLPQLLQVAVLRPALQS